MKAVIVYDSNYGNTRAVAEAIAAALTGLRARLVPAEHFVPGILDPGDLLIVGSPINGWQPTAKVQQALAELPSDALHGVRAAAFDTRVRLFIHGDAARKISKALQAHGARIISTPMAFHVEGRDGPLADGELQRAASWAGNLLLQLRAAPKAKA
ncbi:Flavodoxin domain protein [Arthrobacter saudimassiliensis]|uniref:Flavodoxin domain protein n=1 Tax=Arthrobacter saudimassiliensis TaxID=1461584 RepID=A0A078MWX7_9MICC|nr:Flavodoxin domain protein [Arthrobacter saudimassiliensis]